MSDEKISKRIKELSEEKDRLESEIRKLEVKLPKAESELPHLPSPLAKSKDQSRSLKFPSAKVTFESPEVTKIKLFRSLFRGREDVFAQRWEFKEGKCGYSPAHQWNQDGSKSDQYSPITDHVIRNHLLGKKTIGVYALLKDETCWFLAVDFDKKSWQKDTSSFKETCDELDVPCYLERSRSGKGGHAWFFFSANISASIARNFGSLLLTWTMERFPQANLDSYDRLFPNQDTMPKGGFGNLIALPLQKKPRQEGNSLFIDEKFTPYADQWKFLSEVKRINQDSVESILSRSPKQNSILGVRAAVPIEEYEKPWTLPPSGRLKSSNLSIKMPDKIEIVLSNMIFIDKKGLPPSLINKLVRIAAFQNPEFYRAQAMRLSTFGKPRIVSCAEDFPNHLALPRGCLSDISYLFEESKVQQKIEDLRVSSTSVKFSFDGNLFPEQFQAAKVFLENDTGVLAAGTAFGKTIVAIYLIAIRKVNTLILVHRKQLIDQWYARLTAFLNIDGDQIGIIGGGRNSPKNVIDIATLQSINRKGIVKDLVADYGHVIVDECHHISAFSFETIMRKVKARYVLGLTATPIRKDGYHPIIYMQCGPIRFKTKEKKRTKERKIQHKVFVRPTDFTVNSELLENFQMQKVYAAIGEDFQRNELIISDIRHSIDNGFSPLVLTERTSHLKFLGDRLRICVPHVIDLKGGMGKPQYKKVMDSLKMVPKYEERVILATGRYIGEGFDDARLDALFLTMPVSWRGTLIQYIGRLHRTYDWKHEVRVFDYVDKIIPNLERMFEKRRKCYESIGYEICTNFGSHTKEEGSDLE